jgi:hypothetical protein
MKSKYSTPVPTTTVFTKLDCSPSYSKVTELQQEFGFEYAAVIGSLICLINTYIRLNHSIRKLVRFMHYQGRNHFKLLLHLLRHLQYHRLKGGVKFYSDKTKSPPHQHLTTTDNGNVAEYPIVCFSDSSFQDCPDSGRSTGRYLIFGQGAVVDVTSTMPQLVTWSTCDTWSTCEGEYCMGVLAAMAAFFIRKVHNELHGIDPDYPLTTPIGIDSKSAMDTAVSYKDTQRARHFSRRFHFIRIAIASSIITNHYYCNNLNNNHHSPLITLEQQIVLIA